MAQLQFDASTVAPQASYTPIPAGVYTVSIDDSEIKPTQKGGQMAVFRLRVLEGQHAGRTVFARINVRNPSQQAEQIGQAQLSALCHAAGVLQLSDTAQLHNKVVRARVKIRKDATGQYEDQNEVSGFEATGGPAPVAAGFVAQAPAAAPAAAGFVAQAPAAAPAAAAQPPWKRAAA